MINPGDHRDHSIPRIAGEAGAYPGNPWKLRDCSGEVSGIPGTIPGLSILFTISRDPLLYDAEFSNLSLPLGLDIIVS